MKSRERMTVYTQVASDPEVYFEPQFVLKGKGKRKRLVNQPDHILVQWAEKGSYREQHMLKTIHNIFAWAIGDRRFRIFVDRLLGMFVTFRHERPRCCHDTRWNSSVQTCGESSISALGCLLQKRSFCASGSWKPQQKGWCGRGGLAMGIQRSAPTRLS